MDNGEVLTMIETRRVGPGETDLAAVLNPLIDEGTFWDNEQARLFLADGNNALFLAEEGGTAIGYATANRLQRFDNRRAEVLLYDISVEEAYHRRGAGRALIARVLDWAREVGAENVWVLADSDDARACAFYAGTGGEQFVPNSTMFTYMLEDTAG
jgi:GNAT superfamily N-acetyltransferase